MATDEAYIEYVLEQLDGVGVVRYRKMFGDYMVYVNDKPIFLVCDNTVYVKMHEAVADIMKNSGIGTPYTGAKEHYILDVDNTELIKRTAEILEPLTPFPKPKKKKV